MSKTTYRIVVDGKTIATRKSDRVYTHAVVAWNAVDAGIAHAERPATKYDSQFERNNFAYYTKRAAYTAGVPTTVEVTDCHKPWSYQDTLTQEQIDACKAKIDGGYVAYLSRLRAAEIERAKAVSREPFVYGYCGRPDLAAKLLAKAQASTHLANAQIVTVAT